jgi:hypothetical protein
LPRNREAKPQSKDSFRDETARDNARRSTTWYEFLAGPPDASLVQGILRLRVIAFPAITLRSG